MAQFHVKTGWNWWFFFCFIWLKKWNWLMVSWVKTGIKLWNRPEVGREKKWNWRHAVSGKKMKLTARGCAAAVSFIFFPTPRPSVSFFSRPTLDGFTILASFTHETTGSFIFEPKKQKNKSPVSPSFTWNWPKKKKMRFLAKTVVKWWYSFIFFFG